MIGNTFFKSFELRVGKHLGGHRPGGPVEAVFSNLAEDAVGFIDSQILKKFAEYGYSQQGILSNLHRVCTATVGATTIYSVDGRELFGVRHVLDLSEGFGVVTRTDTLIFDLNPAK